MTTYNKEQYEKAKARAYKKGYNDAMDMPDIKSALENAQQVQEWKKWDNFDINWTVVLLVIITGAILLSMFTYSPNF